MWGTGKKKYSLFFFMAVMSLTCYFLIAYIVPRAAFESLLVIITVLFVTYTLMTTGDFAKDYFWELLLLSLLVRLIFLFAIPSLSDDYFRFLWDGVLTTHGTNPYMYTPESVPPFDAAALPSFMVQLKENMNSPSYFSPYPPVLQGVFWLCVKLGGNSLLADLLILRIFTIIAEAGTVWMALKILKRFRWQRHRVLLYALNPLVIIELTGNLHSEVFMLFLLLSSFYLLVKQQYFLSAVLLGMAVATKLLPLIFIPAIVAFVGIKKGIIYSLVTLMMFSVSFLPFVDSVFVQHISQSIAYYFQEFEFNASFYYLFRWIGYDVTGFNFIYATGKLMPFLALVLILGVAFFKQIQTPAMLLNRLLFTLLVYFLFSLVVHPWYITVLAGLSVFSTYRFALVWSALVMLTYSTYMQTPYHEILWLTATEYIVLGGIIYAELFYPQKLPVVGDKA